ncbi:unnamed protein product [Effrenium voratum]|uniref:Uncharacterized protein n=1 Tax=Effrenium voratum TaxID=2562239 RepID=A0AA36MS00_9DINO|nr:unnamed protein product [Effrenium voratum]
MHKAPRHFDTAKLKQLEADNLLHLAVCGLCQSEELKPAHAKQAPIVDLQKMQGRGGTALSGDRTARAIRKSAPESAWEPKAVAQVLDALRRSTFRHEALLAILFHRFFGNLPKAVHPLTQASWCLIELDALDRAKDLKQELPDDEPEQGFPEARYAMRRVFELLEGLDQAEPFTPTQPAASRLTSGGLEAMPRAAADSSISISLRA